MEQRKKHEKGRKKGRWNRGKKQVKEGRNKGIGKHVGEIK